MAHLPIEPRAPGQVGGTLADWTRRLRKTARIEFVPTHALDIEAEDAEWSFSVEHVRRYIASAGADDGWDGPRPIVILYTRGRASNRVRRTALLCFEHEGQRYVVGSRGGTPGHPSWYLNLAQEHNVHVRAGPEFYAARAVTLPSADRSRIWPFVIARYPMFANYQAATVREIPVVRLDAPASAL